jgi:hypothetical protein
MVTTNHWKSGTSENYNLNFEINRSKKLPVKVVFTGGPNLFSPVDIAKQVDWPGYFAWVDLGSTRPAMGDTYTFNVTYSDNSSENLTSAVTGVLDSFAQNLSPTGSCVSTTPTFTWNAPASPPSTYGYRLSIEDQQGGGRIWEYPEDGLMSSSQTSVLYNVDGEASQPALTSGVTYNWSITVVDANWNSATYQVSCTP